MQDIEKLAHSVFEDAAQEPPKEVWDSIESRLQGSAPQSGASHGGKRGRWIMIAGAGAVVAAALAFAVAQTRISNVIETSSEPTAQLTTIEENTMPEGAYQEALGDEEQSQQRGSLYAEKQTPQIAVTRPEEKVNRQPVDNQVSDQSGSQEEPIFDLLEYQLSSHEYDIPSNPQQAVSQQEHPQAKPSEQSGAKPSEPQQMKQGDTQAIELTIPNILSPNGDGYNDCWNIPDLAKYGRASVQIFTAQRKRVYASDNYRGEFCGDDLPSGDYFYVLTIRHLNYTRRGVLVIKR